MLNYPEDFVRYLTEAAGKEMAERALSSEGEGVVSSIRINPDKAVPGLPYEMTPVPWSRNGFILGQRPVFTLDPVFHAGAYYVQDSSSMFVGHAFSSLVDMCGMGDRPLKVLDLCAAPGGKTTDIASRMPSGSVLVANEVMKQRASVLKENVALWGNPDIIVTNSDPKDFGDRLPDFFDVIVVDAPCSGEGMFRKDESALAQWSTDNVELCSSRQKRILADVWPSLKEGGLLIYSTCTFNRYENSGNVKWMSDVLGADIISVDSPEALASGAFRDESGGWTFLWGIVPGEGQYCSAVRKKGESVPDLLPQSRRKTTGKVPESLSGLFRDMSGLSLTMLPSGMLKASTVQTESVSASLEKRIRIVSSGLAAGFVKGKDFVPDADLSLSLLFSGDAFPVLEVDRQDALKFLAREPISADGMPRGILTVSYLGLPLGFVKNIGSRVNTLHPAGRRIRMDIR